jgi:hypothetical protein
MNQKLTHSQQEMAQQGPQEPPAPVTVAILLIAVSMLALAGLLRLVQLRSAGDTLAPVAALAATGENAHLWQTAPEEEYAFYTERYWQMAAAREARPDAHPHATGPYYASYTDRYWQMAAAREASLSATSAAPGAPVTSEYSTYTDRYWQMASEREVRLAAAAAGR